MSDILLKLLNYSKCRSYSFKKIIKVDSRFNFGYTLEKREPAY